MSVTAASASRYLSWPGVVFRQLTDAAPSILAIGVRDDTSTSRLTPSIERVLAAVRDAPGLVREVARGMSGAPTVGRHRTGDGARPKPGTVAGAPRA